MPERARPSCYDKAVELLGRRPHFRRRLAAKLAQRGYEEEEVAAALARLAAQGYLDDARLAREVARGRATRAGEGARRIKAELERRGASAADAAAAVADVAADDDTAAAAEAARRWRRRGGSDAAALARHLDRKGFSRRAILTVLRRAGMDAPDAEG